MPPEYQLLQVSDIRFAIVVAEVLIKVSGYIEMFVQKVWIIDLETKKGGEALHFDQLRFQFAGIVDAYAKVKRDHLCLVIFIGHIFAPGNAAIGSCFKTGLANHLNDMIAGVEHFSSECFVYEHGCFCYSKLDCTWVFAVEISQESLVGCFAELLIECRS